MKKSKLFQSWGTFRKGLDAQSIQLSFASHLEYSLSKDQYTATNRDLYLSLALSARDRLIERWIKTQQKYYKEDVKRVYYLSAEYLMGRVLTSNLINLGMYHETRRAMEELDIVYHWAGRQLGGHRPARPHSAHRALEEGLRGYADYMETDFFQQSAAQLINLAAKSPTAMLCAEISPQRCHRRLIADYLVLRGAEVIHLIAVGDACVHHLSPEARRESAQLIYDRHRSAELPFESGRRGGG